MPIYPSVNTNTYAGDWKKRLGKVVFREAMAVENITLARDACGYELSPSGLALIDRDAAGARPTRYARR